MVGLTVSVVMAVSVMTATPLEVNSRTQPLFANHTSGGRLKLANRRFEAIRANRSHVVNLK